MLVLGARPGGTRWNVLLVRVWTAIAPPSSSASIDARPTTHEVPSGHKMSSPGTSQPSSPRHWLLSPVRPPRRPLDVDATLSPTLGPPCPIPSHPIEAAYWHDQKDFVHALPTRMCAGPALRGSVPGLHTGPQPGPRALSQVPGASQGADHPSVCLHAALCTTVRGFGRTTRLGSIPCDVCRSDQPAAPELHVCIPVHPLSTPSRPREPTPIVHRAARI